MDFEHSRQRFQLARQELSEWIHHHIKASTASFLASVLGLPAVLLISGASLKEQAAELVGYGILGPLALVGVAFIVAWLRAGPQLYKKRTDELRVLRQRLGLATDDLDPPPRLLRRSRKTVIERVATLAGFATGAAFAAFIGWQDYTRSIDIKTVLRANGRHLPDFQIAAHKIRAELDTAIKSAQEQKTLADQRWHEINDKGGYKDRISSLSSQLRDGKATAAPPAPEMPTPETPIFLARGMSSKGPGYSNPIILSILRLPRKYTDAWTVTSIKLADGTPLAKMTPGRAPEDQGPLNFTESISTNVLIDRPITVSDNRQEPVIDLWAKPKNLKRFGHSNPVVIITIKSIYGPVATDREVVQFENKTALDNLPD